MSFSLSPFSTGEGTMEVVENSENVFDGRKEDATDQSLKGDNSPDDVKTLLEKMAPTMTSNFSSPSLLSSSSIDQASKSSTGSFSDLDQDAG